VTTLDPAYCADGCGRLAETERPTADGRTEQVCTGCAHIPARTAHPGITFDQDMGEL
jgi:hypothetical protein